MEENKSVINGEFDRSGRYDAGLKALAKSLQLAFLLLLIGIIGTLVYFFSGAGYFSVEPQQAVIVARFGKIVNTKIADFFRHGLCAFLYSLLKISTKRN